MDNIFSIKVNAGKSYPVYIDKGLLRRSGKIFSSLFPNCKIAVISDDVVASLYLDVLLPSLKNSGFNVVSYVFPNGEQNKNLSTFSNIVNFLADNEITRSDVVVAFGGGVVGERYHKRHLLAEWIVGLLIDRDGDVAYSGVECRWGIDQGGDASVGTLIP